MESELQKEKTQLLDNLSTYNDYVTKDLERLEKEKQKLTENKNKFEMLNNYEKEFSSARAFTIAELHAKYDSFPITKKLGRTAKFYKCLRDSLEEKYFLNHDYCKTRFKPKLSDEETSQVKNWTDKTGIKVEIAANQKKDLPAQIKRNEEGVENLERNYMNSIKRVESLKDSLKLTEMKIQETKLIPANKQFMNCDTSTPVINLEEEVPYKDAKFKGPFYNVPRDNQDGLGTCYANAAKNLLVGVSEGKDVASFLDLALHYKNSNGTLTEDGLNAGSSCSTLNAVQEKGYCPQEFSPLETGERNQAGEGLFNLGTYNYLATNVNLIRDFLNGLSKFEKSNSPVTAEVLKKSSRIIASLKANPEIIIPLPIVRNNVPEEWKLKEAHAMKKLEAVIPYDKFLDEHREAYRKFYPHYIKAVIAGKNLDEIFEIYKTDLNEFITKYQLESSLEEFKRVFKLRAKNDFEDPKLKEKLTDSFKFLKDIMDKTEMSDESFYEFCASSGGESMSLLNSMGPLIDKIREDKINEEKLFNDKGQLRSALELMQLTVAPSCLNQENRKAVMPFTCDNGYSFINKVKGSGKTKDEQIKMLRERVVLSLVQGYPLGNSFPTTSNSGHINTIVGLRFNQQTNSCQYLIRESQTGTTGWTNESAIFDRIQALTEVRRIK